MDRRGNYLKENYKKNKKFAMDEAEWLEALPQKCRELFIWHLHQCLEDGIEVSNEFIPDRIFDCKSPIEQIYLMAFTYCCNDYHIYFYLDPQFRIECDGRVYYADLLFDSDLYFQDIYTSENSLKLIIECDGFQYHNATKTQVKRDNERDLCLKKSGYDVLHFSGSQIYENPIECAEETIDYIFGKMGFIKDRETGKFIEL